MSVFSLKTQDLSWQDRTINVEYMVAPTKSQLLYNKHKGLKTKFDQESIYLEREKDSYIKAYKTEQRLLERRKDLYSKIRNDIILRRASADERRRASLTGRASAPPRLEQDNQSDSKTNMTFVTEIPARDTKSAGARTASHERMSAAKANRLTDTTKLLPPPTPDMRTVSPSVSVRSPTPGKPYLLREKTVRFEKTELPTGNSTKEKVQIPVQDRIKHFLTSQAEFNKRGPQKVTDKFREEYETNNRQLLARRRSSYNLNIAKLEGAFDEFCMDGSSDGLTKLVKYASKMRAYVKNVRPPSTNLARQRQCMVKT